ncbi:MAG TPA: tyrosine-type recombinase/integrase [Acidimicrobiales bacterium]
MRNRGTNRSPRWFAYLWVATADGRKQASKGPFRTKSEAEEWLREQTTLAREGRPMLPSKMTTGQWLTEWVAVASHALRPSTVAQYRAIIGARLSPHLGLIPLQQLRPAHVAACYDGLRAPGANRRGVGSPKGLSETSVRRSHEVLRRALEDARRQGLVSANVADLVVKPKVGRTTLRVWNAADLAAFLRTVTDDRLFPMLRLAAYSGMRRAELLGLRWEHVDLDSGVATVVATRTKVGAVMVDGEPKTDTGRRSVDLDEATVAVLRRWRTRQLGELLAWGPAYQRSEYVFTREDGSPVHADHVAQRFTRLLRASGRPVIRLHDLRHTHATLLLKAGVPVKVVSERLGHASPAFTMNVYQHVLPGMQAEAAATFARLVEG